MRISIMSNIFIYVNMKRCEEEVHKKIQISYSMPF